MSDEFRQYGSKLEEQREARDWEAEGIHYERCSPQWSRGVPLPVHRKDLSTYRARYLSAEAIIVPDGEAQELRVPYVTRYYPGDFSKLMDELVNDLGLSTVRFANVSPPGTASAIKERLGTPDPADLRDVLHGFEETSELWTTDDGTEEEVKCLLGEWEPDEH